MPYLDSQNIFPKRLGIMNGNTLILEYYNLTKDKFKKHPIPFNPLNDVKIIIEDIFKNVKHIPYLKKIDPKHVKAVLEGQSTIKKSNKIEEKEADFGNFYEKQKPKEIKKQDQYNFEQSIGKNSEKSHKSQRNKYDGHKEDRKQPQQIDDYYAEEFQEFQISQSVQKGNGTISSISNVQKSEVSNSQVNSSSLSKNQQQTEVKPEIKPKKKDKKIQQAIAEQYEDDFQFIDEQQLSKDKKKKEKKDKKDKKSKSKEKKQKKDKKVKDQSKQKEQTIVSKQQKIIEEQFQFL